MTLKTTDSDEAFVQAARDQYQDDGTLEIDYGATVSRGDGYGHYVQAWVWVAAEYPSDEELEAIEAEGEKEDEEAETLRKALVRYHAAHIRQMVLEDESFLKALLRNGQKGYNDMGLGQLRNLAKGRDLIEED